MRPETRILYSFGTVSDGHGAHLRASSARSGAVGSPRSVGVGFGAQPRLKQPEPGCGAEPHAG